MNVAASSPAISSNTTSFFNHQVRWGGMVFEFQTTQTIAFPSLSRCGFIRQFFRIFLWGYFASNANQADDLIVASSRRDLMSFAIAANIFCRTSEMSRDQGWRDSWLCTRRDSPD